MRFAVAILRKSLFALRCKVLIKLTEQVIHISKVGIINRRCNNFGNEQVLGGSDSRSGNGGSPFWNLIVALCIAIAGRFGAMKV